MQPGFAPVETQCVESLRRKNRSDIYPIIPLSNYYQPHQPDDKEDIGQDFVKRGQGDEPRDDPEDEVDVEENVPQPLAVVELAEDVSFLRHLHLRGGRD